MELPVTLLFGVALSVLLCVRCNTLLVYFQQEEYDDHRFARAWQNVRLYDVIASVATLVCLVAGWIFSVSVAALFVLSCVYGFIAWRETRYSYKKPLVNTERVRRLRAVCLALLVLLALLSSFYPLLALAVLQFVPLALVLANKLLQPAQRKLNQGFIAQASHRLQENHAIPIGVTGSFGKTTVKHMLAEMLSVGGPVFYSRGSVNTVLGLTRHIRQRLQPSHRFFVAEMGAYQIGSIDRLCEFVKPRYGIVTAIGEAHAERFGGIENTARAKSELANWVCRHGEKLVVTEAVLSHSPFAQLQQRYPQKFVVVGHSPSSDVSITHSEMLGGKWNITLALTQGRQFSYSLPLLGDHNILNSALAVALVDCIDPGLLSRLPSTMAELEQVAHRLELREIDGEPLILDDAYNSNEQGFTNAVEVLHKLATERGGRAILVTPGIAELGDEHDEVHQRLGTHSAGLCDVVVVVNPDRIPTFAQALSGSPGRLAGRLVTAPSLSAARQELDALELVSADVILYENDLPDLLEEKRRL